MFIKLKDIKCLGGQDINSTVFSLYYIVSLLTKN